MDILFYKVVDEPNKIEKNLNEEIKVSGKLTGNTSLLNPVIRIKLNGNITAYNYAVIPVFGRYYYITDINVDNTEMIISLHCDVLMSFKNDILNSYAHITRSNYGNKYLKDSLAYTTERPVITYRKLGTCFKSKVNYIMVKGGN